MPNLKELNDMGEFYPYYALEVLSWVRDHRTVDGLAPTVGAVEEMAEAGIDEITRLLEQLDNEKVVERG